ncbi:MAG TPA: hypothetical protein VJ757_07145 [Pseudonocardiaceae bacterium]|nr:hypothetical protein [Pseudonocardiaceae bacterium]
MTRPRKLGVKGRSSMNTGELVDAQRKSRKRDATKSGGNNSRLA